MEIRHYITTDSMKKGVFIENKTQRVDSNNINDIKVTEDMLNLITFDRIISEIEVNGKKYPVATRKLNQKEYKIGKFVSLKELNLDPVTLGGFMAKNCIGKVISSNGLESFVFEGQGIIDPKNKENIVIKESKMLEENKKEIEDDKEKNEE